MKHWMSLSIRKRMVTTVRTNNLGFVWAKIQIVINTQFAKATSTVFAFYRQFKYVQTYTTIKVLLYFRLTILCELILENGVSPFDFLKRFVFSFYCYIFEVWNESSQCVTPKLLKQLSFDILLRVNFPRTMWCNRLRRFASLALNLFLLLLFNTVFTFNRFTWRRHNILFI